MPPFFPYVPPGDVDVVVVEDEGQVVACMTVLRAVHLEGVWIEPNHRKAGVTRSLLRLSVKLATHCGARWAFAGSADGDRHMPVVLSKLGGVKVPMDTYVLPLESALCRRL